MSSEARINANRLNAQKSTGPRTAEGKAVVSQNAVKHGLSGECDVIRGEEQEEFDQYREEMFWELNPLGVMQCRLVERIVSLAWRLRRAERLQNEAFDALLEKEASSGLSWLTGALRSRGPSRPADGADADLSPGTIAAKDFTNNRVLDRLLMYEGRIERSLYRTMNELRKLQHEQELQAGAPARSRNARYCAKQSQILPTDDVHDTPCRSGGAPSRSEDVTNCAKQSQVLLTDGGQSPPQGVDVPPCSQGVTDFAEQSQSAGGETASSVSPTKEETPYGVTTSAGNCAEQSQSAEEVSGLKREVSSKKDAVSSPPASYLTVDTASQPPDGGTPSAGDSAEQSQMACSQFGT